jgi:FkbM family methyltransferase
MIRPLLRNLRQSLLRWGVGVELRPFPQAHPVDLLGLLVQQRAATADELVFVQIGANDGKSGDPINKLIEAYRPRCVLVEPIPAMFERLRQNYAHVPSVVCENCAISRDDGHCTLFHVRHDPSLPEYVRQLASFDRAIILKQRRVVPRIADFIEPVRVPSMSFATLAHKHRLDSIDLLQIDTEGYDFEIIKMVMETPVRPHVINFEHAHLSYAAKVECADLLSRRGYRYLAIGRDTIAHRVSAKAATPAVVPAAELQCRA